MTLAGAVTRINGWSLTGITNWGDWGNGIVPLSSLPALVLDFGEGGKGFDNVDFTSTSGLVAVPMRHYLLASDVGHLTVTKRGLMAGYLDTYLAKVRSDILLNDNLALPIRFTMAYVDVVSLGNVQYWSFVFSMLWWVAV